MLRLLTASATVFAVIACTAVPLSAAPFCKALKGESVSFGEESARKDASEALEKAVVAWAEHYQVAPKPKNRKMVCKVYIEFLGEFTCTAEATLCREIAGSASPAPKSASAPKK